jgi:hypothetical protein
MTGDAKMADAMNIKVRSIFELVTTLKNANQDEAFIQQMEKNGAFVTVTMDTINAAKQFFATNDLHETTPFGRTIGISINAITQQPDPGCQNGHCGHTVGFDE